MPDNRKLSVLAIGLSAGVLALSAPACSAAQTVPDPYRWCAVFSGTSAGGPNCWFVTYNQCMETQRGMGGFCRENLWYTGPTGERPRRHVRRVPRVTG
jgi:hypothetical protein